MPSKCQKFAIAILLLSPTMSEVSAGSSAAFPFSEDDDDYRGGGWREWSVSLGISTQQPNLTSSSRDTVQRGLEFSLCRDWSSGALTLIPSSGVAVYSVRGTASNYDATDASLSLEMTYGRGKWLSGGVAAYYLFADGPQDRGVSGLVRGTWNSGSFASMGIGVSSTWFQRQHGSIFVMPFLNLYSSWWNANIEFDLGEQWQSYSQLQDSTFTPGGIFGIRLSSSRQVIGIDSGMVPMLRTSASFALHHDIWSLGPNWGFQAWEKTSTKSNLGGSLTERHFTNSWGIWGTLRATRWLNLGWEASYAVQTQRRILSADTLARTRAPTSSVQYPSVPNPSMFYPTTSLMETADPWIATSHLLTGWSLSLTAGTHW